MRQHILEEVIGIIDERWRSLEGRKQPGAMATLQDLRRDLRALTKQI